MDAREKYRTIAEDLRRRAAIPNLTALREQALALAAHFDALAAEADDGALDELRAVRAEHSFPSAPR